MTIRKPDMVGDELGDPADNPRLNEDGDYTPTRYFGYGITIPDKGKDLAAIRVSLGEFPEVHNILERKKVKEIKTRRLPKKYKTWLAKKLAGNSKVYAYVVNKTGEIPQGWLQYNISERIVALAMYSVRESINKCWNDEIFILFDQHSALQTPWARDFISRFIEQLSNETGKDIYFDTAKSSRQPYGDELQVADAVPNFVFDDLERGKHFLRKKARIDLKILGSEDSIELEGLKDYKETFETMCDKNRRGAVFPPKRDMYVIVEVL